MDLEAIMLSKISQSQKDKKWEEGGLTVVEWI